MGITSRLRPEDGWYHTYGKNAADFRAELQPLLKKAVFLDDAWIEQIPEKCFGTCWELPDQRKLVILANDSEPEETFKIAGLQAVLCVGTMDKLLEAPDIQINNEITELRLSKGQLCYILFQ